MMKRILQLKTKTHWKSIYWIKYSNDKDRISSKIDNRKNKGTEENENKFCKTGINNKIILKDVNNSFQDEDYIAEDQIDLNDWK